MSDSLLPHGLQHDRLPCISLSPRVCSNSCPLSQGCHPTISSSVIPVSSCLQSFPASESFPMNWLFASGGQSIEASASDLPVNIQGWFPLGLTDLIFWESKDSQGSSPVSSVHGILQARILEWVAIPLSRVSSWSRDQIHISYVSCISRWVLYP